MPDKKAPSPSRSPASQGEREVFDAVRGKSEEIVPTPENSLEKTPFWIEFSLICGILPLDMVEVAVYLLNRA